MKNKKIIFLLILSIINGSLFFSFIMASTDEQTIVQKEKPLVLSNIKIVSLQGPWSKGETMANFLALAWLANHYYWLIQKGKTLPITTKFEAIDLITTPFIGTYLIFQVVRWYFYMLNAPQQNLEDYMNKNCNEKNSER